MESNTVSEFYYKACSMMHDNVTELYEAIHDEEGSPILAGDVILSHIQGFQKRQRQELDLIKTILSEYTEQG